MKGIKILLIVMMIFVFVIGLLITMYPHIQGATVDTKLKQQAHQFLEYSATEPCVDSTEPCEPAAPPEEIPYTDLLRAMQEYNKRIWEEKQEGLCDSWSYQQPSFALDEYGLENEIFGVISIPVLELDMPLYLGATYQHMADGVAHLSQTSIPIGGQNTNAVIAGHRGWGGAAYFRYVTELKPGDEVMVTNLWGTLTYRVVDTRVIWPYEVDQILIREGQDSLTLLTCHPYASGGKQRYLVICERTE